MHLDNLLKESSSPRQSLQTPCRRTGNGGSCSSSSQPLVGRRSVSCYVTWVKTQTKLRCGFFSRCSCWEFLPAHHLLGRRDACTVPQPLPEQKAWTRVPQGPRIPPHLLKCLHLHLHLLPPLLVDGVEVEGDHGSQQQDDGDRSHEDFQGEDDRRVVRAVTSLVTCKTEEEHGLKSVCFRL